MTRTLVLFLALVGIGSQGTAQPILPNGYSVSLVATGINAGGESMAVDADGYIFILNRTVSPSFVGHTITLVSPSGVVTNNFITNVGEGMSQLAFSPADGAVYVATSNPVLTVVLSTIQRLSPTAGAVTVDTTPLIVDGFTINDQGAWIFGASTAVGQPGLYQQTPGTGTTTYLGPGFGINSLLQSLAGSSDVLIAEGLEVRRWSPTSSTLTPYASYPQGVNSLGRVNSLARSAYDQLGPGALIGVQELSPACNCGTGRVYPGSLTAGSGAPLGTESYLLPSSGMAAIATSIRGPMFWLTDQPPVTPFAGRNLFMVNETGGPGVVPNLQINVTTTMTGSSVTANTWGPPGARVLLGAMAAPSINPALELYTPFGWVLNVFDPMYLPVVDGPGAFGAPNPAGIIPISGNWQWTINLPPVGLSIATQALIESATTAPNGWFHISSLQGAFLP